MRVKVYEPEPSAVMQTWQWELVDDADRLLAASPRLESKAECEDAIEQVTSACKEDLLPVEYVKAPGTRTSVS